MAQTNNETPLVHALGHVLSARDEWPHGDLKAVEGHLERAYRTLRHARVDDLADRVARVMREVESARAGGEEPALLGELVDTLRTAERESQSLGAALDRHQVVRWCLECPFFHYLPETAYSSPIALCTGDPGSTFAVDVAKMNLERDPFCPRARTRLVLTWPGTVE